MNRHNFERSIRDSNPYEAPRLDEKTDPQGPGSRRNGGPEPSDFSANERQILMIWGEATARTLIQGDQTIQWEPWEIEELERLGRSLGT